MKYRVLNPSTAGRRGDILEDLDTEHARQLIAAGLIEAIEDKPAAKKGGKKPKDANPKEKIERK